MPDAISCPHCGWHYPPDSTLVGRKVQCRACDRAFRVPEPPHVAPLPAEALIAPTLPPGPSGHRMNRRHKLLLGAGGILAVFGLGLLLVMAVLFLRSSSGGGPSASSLAELFFGSSVSQTIPPLAGETSQDPVDQMVALVHLMELIRGEDNLRELQPRILELFGQMLQAEAKGQRVPPAKRTDVENALPQFDQRMVAAGARLEIIPGGFDLRRKLVKLVEKTPLPRSPGDPTQEGDAGPLPTIASWVVWGWATLPPPESPEDRQRRQQTRKAAGRNADVVRVYVRGVTSESMVKKVTGKLVEATRGTVVAPRIAGEVRQFHCGNIDDFRRAAHDLDIGPTTKIEPFEGTIHVELDPSKLFDRPKEWISGPILSLESVAMDLPPARSIKLPAPPEPADVRDRRKDVRWEAGENLEGVEVVLHGSAEELNRQAFRRLAAMGQVEKVRSRSDGFRPRTFHCDDIGDMRAFAGKLDLGPIIQFDDQKGVIAVVVDPARFAGPLESETTSP